MQICFRLLSIFGIGGMKRRAQSSRFLLLCRPIDLQLHERGFLRLDAAEQRAESFFIEIHSEMALRLVEFFLQQRFFAQQPPRRFHTLGKQMIEQRIELEQSMIRHLVKRLCRRSLRLFADVRQEIGVRLPCAFVLGDISFEHPFHHAERLPHDQIIVLILRLQLDLADEIAHQGERQFAGGAFRQRALVALDFCQKIRAALHEALPLLRRRAALDLILALQFIDRRLPLFCLHLQACARCLQLGQLHRQALLFLPQILQSGRCVFLFSAARQAPHDAREIAFQTVENADPQHGAHGVLHLHMVFIKRQFGDFFPVKKEKACQRRRENIFHKHRPICRQKFAVRAIFPNGDRLSVPFGYGPSTTNPIFTLLALVHEECQLHRGTLLAAALVHIGAQVLPIRSVRTLFISDGIRAVKRQEDRFEKSRLAVAVHAADQDDRARMRKREGVFPGIDAEILQRELLDDHRLSSSISKGSCERSGKAASKNASLYSAPNSFFRLMRSV